METKNIAIILILICVICGMSFLIAQKLLEEPYKQVELFKNGTRINVPESSILENYTGITTIYKTEKNTTIMGIDSSGFGGLASGIMVSLIEDNSKLENGYYYISKDNAINIANKLGESYDESTVHEGYVKIINNKTLNQTIIIIGADKGEIEKIVNSIVWMAGSKVNVTA